MVRSGSGCPRFFHLSEHLTRAYSGRVTKPTQAESKAKREREVFAAFAKVAPVLNIDPQSIASCEPPKPDIACRTRRRSFVV
jgi:hypothetical protein